MSASSWSWWQQRSRRRSRRHPQRSFLRRRLWVEWLEDRTLPSGSTLVTASLLTFTPFHTAEAAGRLADSQAVDLYGVHLDARDQLTVRVSAQGTGSGLQSILRVFDATGRPVALDDQEGGDPQLTFQAAAAGAYYVGVSSAGNDAYDPTVVSSGHAGTSVGIYTLNLRQIAGAPLRADLAGSSFRLGADTAAWGEPVPVRFTVENRGAADAGGFDIQVLLSSDQLFGPSSLVLKTISLAGLASDQAFSSGTVPVILPDLASAQVAGLSAPRPVYLGLRIDPTHAVPELNSFDQSGVHRGSDWEALTIVTPVTASGSNHSQASADPLLDLNSRVSGVLMASQVDWYQLTVPETRRLTARVTAAGSSTLLPRLTLAGLNGQVLIQSDDGSIVQHLQPGTYYLAVTSRSGIGGYQLVSEFIQASGPLDSLTVGTNPRSVAVADLNGDGIPDLVVADDDAVSVLLGNGDGTFGAPQTFAPGSSPSSVAVADVNGDGKPDLVIANRDDNTVSVLLGNGDGTFQKPQTFAVGNSPRSVVVADVNGDGKPDLVTANYGDNTVSMLLGNGDGTFQSQTTYASGNGPRSVAVADVNGDGRPDLVVANSNDNTVGVLLGHGDGTFQPERTWAVGADPYSVAVADINGDGRPDLIVANRGGYFSAPGTVSVLLGNGEGTFQSQRTFAAGNSPHSVAVADVNGDGRPDLIVANAYDGAVGVLLGNGDGTFQARQTLLVGQLPDSSAAVTDVNGDGRPDLIVANRDNVSSVPAR
jgi:hypothetical protein